MKNQGNVVIIKFIKKLLQKTYKVKPNHLSHTITRNHHNISKTDISNHVIKVINRLMDSGFEAYLVGGSVRDLLLSKSPKDFDVATNATPNQIKKLFKNSRIIGKRFKLVHILFYREVIEVATFRGDSPNTNELTTNDKGRVIRDNVFGSLKEDAWRRDLSINSLYYNIKDGSIIDYTDGFRDINAKTIRMIGEPSERYKEDPVRMIRAIRFAAKLNFTIETRSEKPIFELGHLLKDISNARMFDEVVKLFHCGQALQVHKLLNDYDLFKYLFPHTYSIDNDKYPIKTFVALSFESTDNRIKQLKPVTPAFLFAVLLWFPVRAYAEKLCDESNMPPLVALEKSMSYMLSQQMSVTSIPKRFTQAIREIWLMQYRFPKRVGIKPFNLLQHPRFRAAYDFLALRALAQDESEELANWWTEFQDASETQQEQMVKAFNKKKSFKKRKKKPSSDR